MNKTILALAFAVGLSSFVGMTKAEDLLTGVNSSQSFTTGNTIGYTFQVGANNLSVNQLGNSGGMGQGSFNVGLWDGSGSLLASTTVSLTSSFQRFLWNSISPVTLQSGQNYTIGSVGNGYLSQNADVGTATGLSSYVSIVGAGIGGNDGYTSPSVYTLTYPNSRMPYGINGSGNVNVGPNLQFSLAPYTYSQSETTTVSSTLVGPVAVQQNGTGTTILTAQNSYSGGTVVSAGSLVANGPNSPTSSLGTGNITINSGGTLLVNGDNAMGYDPSRVVTINAGGTLTINGVNTEHLSQVVLNGGTIASPSSIGSIEQNYGTFNLDNGVTAGGVSTTSIITAQNVTLTQTGGTIFNVARGATSGVDLLVTGTLNNAPSQTSSTGLIKQGNGVMEMTANNSFSGPTIVNTGSLVISSTGSLSGGGNVTVNSGATLQNNGLIAGATTVGGTLAGNGGSFSSLKFNSDSSLIWDVGSFTGTAGTAWDVLNAQSLDLSYVSSFHPITINIEGISGVGNGSSSYVFNFMNVAGSVTGFSPSDFSVNASLFTPDPSLFGGVWSINSIVVGGVTELQAVYAVPEPSTYALLGLGALALIVAYRRKVV
jgi:autotransporter-associated beta strand protein